MNTSFYTLISKVFIGVLFICSFKTYSQEVSTVPTAPIRFLLSFDDDMDVCMKIDLDTKFDIASQQYNPKAKELMQQTLDLIYKKIALNSKLQLVPIDALKGKIHYSPLGYPLTTFKKARKTNANQQYVGIEVNMGGAKASTKTSSNMIGRSKPFSSISKDVDLYPELKIELVFFNPTTKKRAKKTGKYRHNETVYIATEKIITPAGGFTLNKKADPIDYFSFLEKALDDLIQKLPQ